MAPSSERDDELRSASVRPPEQGAFRDRDQAEAAAHGERELLELIIRHLPVAVNVIRGSDLRIQLVNPAYQAIAPGKAMVGKTLNELWPETGRDFVNICRQVLATGESHHEIDGRHMISRTPGGPAAEAYFTWSLFRVRLPADEGWALLNTAWETTARKRSEAALREIEQQLLLDLETMTRLQKLGTLFVREGNVEAVFDEILQAAITVSGADYGTIQLLDPKSSHLRIVAQRGFAPWWVDFWNQVAAGQGVCGTVLERGERVIVEDVETSPIFLGTPALDFQRRAGVRAVQSTPLVSRSGRLLGMFSTHYKVPHRPDDRALRLLDLLARQAGDILARARDEEALRESEARFRTLADNMSQFAWMADETGGTFWYNRRWYEYTGTTLEEMQGWGWQKVHHPGHVQRVVEKISHCFQTGEAWEDIFPLRGKDGQYRWFLSRAMPIHDERGKVVRWFGTNTDVTAQREAEEALRRLNVSLDERVQARTAELQRLTGELALAEQRERQRLAMVLHDGLQQLLVSCRMHLNLLERAKDWGAVLQGCRELSGSLEEALGLSRSLSAELSPPALHQDGLVPAFECLSAWMQDTHRFTVDLTVYSAVPVEDEATKVLLFQAVRELLFNAVKHAQVQQARVEIGIQNGSVRIFVADEGAGFDPTKVQPVGVGGLGLHSIRQRLEFLGGTLAVDSAPGQGSRFTLTVPIRGVRAEAARDRPGPPQHSHVEPIRILVVDDHRVVREALARMLGTEPGFQVVAEAADGEEAVELARMLRPDLIIMDVNMPKLDGIEATRRIRSDYPHIQVVGLSMYEPNGPARRRMEEAGAVAFVSKGAPSEALLATLRTSVKRERA